MSQISFQTLTCRFVCDGFLETVAVLLLQERPLGLQTVVNDVGGDQADQQQGEWCGHGNGDGGHYFSSPST